MDDNRPTPQTTNVKNVILQKTTIFSVIVFLLLGSGCSKNDTYFEHTPDKGDKVYIRAYQNRGIQNPDFTTKTVIGGESLDKTYWSELDQIMIYYRPAEGSDPLSSQPFSLYRPYPDETLFSATMPEQSATDYTYYGAYPIPESVDGTRVTYTLPAIQDGTYDMRNYDITDPDTYDSYKGNLDIMIAEPATAPALQNGEALGMNFHHQCHVLRVQVPTGRNQWGENVQKLRIEFPTAVVGKMELDLTNPTAAPTLTEGSNTINVELKKLLTESEEDAVDGCYVWVFLCPTTVNGTIRFTAYDANGYQSNSLTTTVNKTMAAGAITPITLTVPDELPVTWIDFSITGNNLGETPDSLIVTAPTGATFRNGTDRQVFAINSDNIYSVAFYSEVDGISVGELIQNQGLTLTYDSEHARVSEIKQIVTTTGNRTPINLTVPYLFFEDFSNISAFNSNLDQNTGNPDAIWLDQFGAKGWSACRTAAETGKSLKISVRHETIAQYPGRVDSPTLTGIKEGKTVKVSVTFNTGQTNKWVYCRFGTTQDNNLHKGDNEPENGYKEISFDITDNISYDFIPSTYTIQNESFINNCTNTTRLSWNIVRTYQSGYPWDSEDNQNAWYSKTWYVYLDNIKVSIVP